MMICDLGCISLYEGIFYIQVFIYAYMWGFCGFALRPYPGGVPFDGWTGDGVDARTNVGCSGDFLCVYIHSLYTYKLTNKAKL